jgi:L-seryl-tRNA(Ser) seleniumtransferase
MAVAADREEHMETRSITLRSLPSVEQLLQTEFAANLMSSYGRPLTLEAIRAALDMARAEIQSGSEPPTVDMILNSAQEKMEAWLFPTLRPIINATGVIIHTNLGRAPLSRAALDAINQIALGYSNLEYALELGVRGKRELHCEELLCRLTGGEAAFVVNNNAGAVLLALSALAKRRSVLISRSQLIEIGGGFRIPDVMRQSGAKLIEVGTTNRTHLSDFEAAIDSHTALILLAHHSNFRIVGFTTEPALSELIGLGESCHIPVLHDIGSGSLLDTTQFGLAHEPMVQESIREGASLVAFSGDKLLGGPQAGILVGRKVLIEKLRKHPLARSIRPDKLCLAALAATLRHYLKDEALREIPIWKMIAASTDTIRERSLRWISRLGRGEIVQGQSTVGGGSLPGETLPTWLVALRAKKPNAFAARLRGGHIPIIARVENDSVVFDPRTVLPEQEQDLLEVLASHLRSME